MKRASIVYLLHFLRPLAHARHYLGFSENLDKRLTDHLCGQGARLMEVCFERGIEWKLARTWQGNRELERRLKRRHGAADICPLCSGNAALRRAIFTTKGGRDQ
jgi:predicted GIY-YIG superfamily endonuclease